MDVLQSPVQAVFRGCKLQVEEQLQSPEAAHDALLLHPARWAERLWSVRPPSRVLTPCFVAGAPSERPVLKVAWSDGVPLTSITIETGPRQAADASRGQEDTADELGRLTTEQVREARSSGDERRISVSMALGVFLDKFFDRRCRRMFKGRSADQADEVDQRDYFGCHRLAKNMVKSFRSWLCGPKNARSSRASYDQIVQRPNIGDREQDLFEDLDRKTLHIRIRMRWHAEEQRLRLRNLWS